MQMTSRERLLAALRGREVDRLPWSPFLAYWWEHQPKELRDRGQIRFFREIGADALLRGFTTPFSCSDLWGQSSYSTFSQRIPGCEVRRSEHGDDVRVWFETPVGTLTQLGRRSELGNTRFLVEHPVKRREDYKVLSYIVERMVILPDFGAVENEIAAVGDDGLSVPLISPFGKTPFQSLVEHFVGTEQLVFDLMDYPEEVEALLAVMSARTEEAVRISVASPAEAFITWEDSSTTNVSPVLFRRYIFPEMKRWAEIVHADGKLLLHHACGHLKALLPIIAEEGVDAVESLSPPPTGNVEIWEAQAVLGKKMGLVGGIEPVHLLNLDLPGLRVYVEELLDRMDHRGWILANSDSCPPGVTLEKFRLVRQVLDEQDQAGIMRA
jgi:uroporphyrinogen-III decarboxylase